MRTARSLTACRGGMHGRGHAWQGACMAGECTCMEGACMVGGMHGGGACVAGWVCMAYTPQTRYYEIRSMSRRYASYWNAFLLKTLFKSINLTHSYSLQKYKKCSPDSPWVKIFLFFLHWITTDLVQHYLPYHFWPRSFKWWESEKWVGVM